jgi:hypothetical protein
MHKSHLLSLIADDRLEDALGQLDNMLIHSKLYNELVYWRSEYKHIRNQYHKHQLDGVEYSKKIGFYREAIITFIEELDDRELLQQILLLSPDAAAHEQLAPYFKRYFPNTAEHCDGKVLAGAYAFVVCNDFFTTPDQQANFDTLMLEYKDAGYYLVCATENNRKELVNDNRDKIYAANSKFALYARVREMIDFVRYFK